MDQWETPPQRRPSRGAHVMGPMLGAKTGPAVTRMVTEPAPRATGIRPNNCAPQCGWPLGLRQSPRGDTIRKPVITAVTPWPHDPCHYNRVRTCRCKMCQCAEPLLGTIRSYLCHAFWTEVDDELVSSSLAVEATGLIECAVLD